MKYIIWAAIVIASYPLIAYSLGSRWEWWIGVLVTSILYLLWKPWLLSPFEGKFKRERTRSEEMTDWFKDIHNEQKTK